MLCIFHSKITVVFRSSCCTKVAFVLFINKPVQPVYVCAPFGNLTLLWHCALLRLHLFLLQFFTLWSLKKANSNLTYSQSWWTLQTHFRRMHAGSSRCIFFCLLVHLPRITALGPFAFFFPIYSLICARPPPLPHLAPTACFDLLSFCRSAYIMSFPNQWSALVFFVFFALAKYFSGLTFPHSCWLISHTGILLWGGKDGKDFSLGVGMYPSVHVSPHGENRQPLQLWELLKYHMLQTASVLKDMETYRWHT